MHRLDFFCALVTFSIFADGSPLRGTAPQEIGLAPSLDEIQKEIQWLRRKQNGTLELQHFNAPHVAEKDYPTIFRRSVHGIHLPGIDVTIGTPALGAPPQTIRLLLDTGSPEIVIPLDSCTTCKGTVFRPELSTSYLDTGATFSAFYEDGSHLRGTQAFELFKLDPFPIVPHLFAGITSEAEGSLRVAGNAGILGLAPNYGRASFFRKLLEKNALDKPVVSLYNAKSLPDGTPQSQSCFGCIDISKIRSGSKRYIRYYDTIKGGRNWDLPAVRLYVDGKVATNAFDATIDTGTDYVVLPSRFHRQFYANAKIPGFKRHVEDEDVATFPCNTKLPRISIGFETPGHRTLYDIDPRELILGSIPQAGNEELCMGAVFGKGDEEGTALIGGSFLRNWYTIFDFERNRIGFAKAI